MRALLVIAILAVLAACSGPVPMPSALSAPPVTPVPTGERPAFDFAIDCGPLDPVACEQRVAELMDTEDPSTVESITIFDEKGSYTLCWTDRGCVTGIFD